MTNDHTRLSRLQEQIEARRVQRGLSMRELSLKAGLNESAVKAIMYGRSESPRGKTLQAIANALGTTVVELIGQEPGIDLSNAAEAASDSSVPELGDAIEAIRERIRLFDAEIQELRHRIEVATAVRAELLEMITKLSQKPGSRSAA